MFIRRALLLLVGAGLVATLTTAGVGASASADSGPLIAAGTVRSVAGEPVAGVLVVARAERDRGDRKVQVELARDLTDAAGRFDLVGMLRGRADRNADGSVRIEIMALAADAVRYRLVNAHPPASEGSDWSSSKALAEEPLTGLNVTLGAAVSGAGPGLARAVAREAELARPCSETAYVYWKETDDTVRRGVPVHFAYVANKSKHTFEYETTTSTSMSVAYTGAGGDYAAGLSSSEEENTSAGLVDTKGGGTTYEDYLWKLQWEFRREEKWCFNAGYPYKMGRSRWLPVRWTGGNWTSPEATTFACGKYRTGSGGDLWVQRNTSSTWNGWFGIGGVELSSRQQRGVRIKATYVLKAGKGRMILCGNDDFPIHASFVEEIAS